MKTLIQSALKYSEQREKELAEIEQGGFIKRVNGEGA